MDNRISIKMDASHSYDEGVGMGYVSKVDDEEYRGRGFIEERCTSTEAEMLATAWSIHHLTQRVDVDPSEYMLVVKTDCENTVNKFDNGYTSKRMRFIEYYEEMYDKMLMFWIPRETNTEADALAKSMLGRKKDNLLDVNND